MNLLSALFYSFVKIGCVGYGGGPSMVPLIKEEVVNLQQWMNVADFMDALAIGNALPGPIATKMSVVIGYHVAGLPGAILATLGIVLPSVLALVLLLKFVAYVKDNPKVKSMLKGLRPVVVAMLAYAAWDLSFGSLTNLPTWIIGAVTLALMIFTKIHPALFVVAGAVAGALLKL
ncbi:MAG: chromate transporter [Synergistaceae bacterium]|jgi:chromate transporter|nr:chromate transporter [Synergistaceae bacterium]